MNLNLGDMIEITIGGKKHYVIVQCLTGFPYEHKYAVLQSEKDGETTFIEIRKIYILPKGVNPSSWSRTDIW